MSSRHVKYLLIGAGLAGSSAAQAIRLRDTQGPILLVGQEVNRPYHRPRITGPYLRRQLTRADLNTVPADWYREYEVELRTGKRVSHLDAPRRSVTLDGGEEINFDSALIATGSQPRQLKVDGAGLPNIFYLRNLDDADRLANALDIAREEGKLHPDGSGRRGRVAVVGGGVLGIELAASLSEFGLHVELLFARPFPWHKFAGDNVGKFVARQLEQHGVRISPASLVSRFEGDGRVQRIITDTGAQIDCDLCVVAIGAQANTALLRGTPIALGKAILVDDHCRTSAEGVYAAGDCAAVFDPLFGKHRIIDHWDNARFTGTLAGANMAGDDVTFDHVSSFSSEVFGLPMSAWGEGKLVSHRLLRGTPTPDAPNCVEIGIAADGRIAQMLAMGSGHDAALMREFVQRRVRVDGNEEQLKDPATDLRGLL